MGFLVTCCKKTLHNFVYKRTMIAAAIVLGSCFIANMVRGNVFLVLEGLLIGLLFCLGLFANIAWKKYVCTLVGFALYLTLIFLYPIKFEVWAQFGFNLPLLLAYMFPEILTPIAAGVIMACVFTMKTNSGHDSVGAIIGILNMSILSALIAQLLRKVVAQRNKYYESSIRDPLTGLYSLQHILTLGQEMMEQNSRVMALLLDVDNFKLINDTYGHFAGNSILVQIAQVLTENLAGVNSVIGRLGGDEFIVLLENYEYPLAKKLSTNLNNSLHISKFTADPELDPVHLNISMGLAYHNGIEKIQIEKLLQKADQDMYYNKFDQTDAIIFDSPDSKMLPTQCHNYLTVLSEKDMYTLFHSRYTAQYAAELAKALRMNDNFVHQLYIAGLLHDIGKVLISNDILRKPHMLTEEEYRTIQEHVKLSLNILSDMNLPKVVVQGIKYHHERWDGLGYPYGIIGEKIPLEARILAIADAYSAMTIKRVYRKSLTPAEAIYELEKNSGTQFDPELVTYFTSCVLKQEVVQLVVAN